MLTRSWTAILLLINYLMVVGMGCMTRPEDQHELLLMRISADSHYYQQYRYLRMDGLEVFLAEALSSRYQNAPETPKHPLITVVNGIDAHDLIRLVWLLIPPITDLAAAPLVCYLCTITSSNNRVAYPPPRLR